MDEDLAFPLTRILKVGDLPAGTDVPAFGASGVMPFLVAAAADDGRSSAPATMSVSMSLVDMRPTLSTRMRHSQWPAAS